MSHPQDEGSLMLTSGLVPELNSNKTMLTINSTRDYILKLFSNSKYANEIADFYTKDLKNPTQLELR